MKSLLGQSAWLSALSVLTFLPGVANAWQPDANELQRTINAADCDGYLAESSTWLDGKVPGSPSGISEGSLETLLDDPVFAKVLAQRQVIAKVGADHLADFARGGSKNKAFLAWLMQNTEAMELYLLGATPVGTAQRKENRWSISPSSLPIWSGIFHSDEESKEGIYLKLAIAICLNPPGTGNPGAGQAKTPSDPLARYQHFKTAHKNKELFPSFNYLTVLDYRQIVSSNASNEDLAWAREMINTWRPDLRTNEQVVNSTSDVWRRFSPFPFEDTFKNVLAGGGKCGPRSSWSVFVCQAFGIPAVGVGQPGHACAAYRSAFPQVQPQPGSVWKVVYGRDWQVSKVCGVSGPEFLAEMKVRSHRAIFSRIEHLRWLASAMTSEARIAAVMAVIETIERDTPLDSWCQVENVEDALSEERKPEPPWTSVPGGIHVLASSFEQMGGQVSYEGLQVPGVLVHDSVSGGKQIQFQSNMQSAWVDYRLDIPKSGVYLLTVRTAAANYDQKLEVRMDGTNIATVDVPMSTGLWATTPTVELNMEEGNHTLRLSTGFQRRVSVKWFELKPK